MDDPRCSSAWRATWPFGPVGEAGYNYTFYLEFPKSFFTDGRLDSFMRKQ